MSKSIPSCQQAIRHFYRLPARPHARSILTRAKEQQSCITPTSSRIALRGKPLSSQCLQLRHFSSSGSQSVKHSSDRTYSRTGVRIALRAAIFIATGAVMVFYFQYEKARLERKRIVEMSKGYGKPKVGGPFQLKDLEGNDYTEKDLLGKYSMIYFGFSHCPDICPDELDKMSEAIDIVQKQSPNTLQSIFISCDPARDTPEVLRNYLAEFHPSIIGLSGTWAQTKEVCKQYRVYFSTPPELTPGEEDYLVDHSIYFYVMDPEGDFVECIGRQDTPESAAGIILQHIKDWKKEGKPLDTTPSPHKNFRQAPAPLAGAATGPARTPAAA